ncbi:MAG TPA: SIS domain-containing protein [Thermomicrobiales bacterium]|nr:SIS domain-containing protein [Thermomicrobiales bacterium]
MGQLSVGTVEPKLSRSAPPSSHQDLAGAVAERRALLAEALDRLQDDADALAAVAIRLVETLRAGGKVLVAGNGGSAAEAQHFAAELVGRFQRERQPYAVVALTADMAILTAVANDYGYQEVFARQVGALGCPGDVFLAFSTSGESENLIRAAEVAHGRGLTVVAVTGEHPSRLAQSADLALRLPATETALVQEVHMVVTHLLCGIVESELSAEKVAGR